MRSSRSSTPTTFHQSFPSGSRAVLTALDTVFAGSPARSHLSSVGAQSLEIAFQKDRDLAITVILIRVEREIKTIHDKAERTVKANRGDVGGLRLAHRRT